jgi:PKD repeat protein
MTAPRARRSAPALVVLASLLAACGGPSPASRALAACTVDADCGTGAYCFQGTCRGSAAPVADFTPPPTVYAAQGQLLQAVVTDADPADAVASYAWTVTPVTGGCAADPATGDAAALHVVFWCAGTYEVTLVATDSRGTPSAPRTRTVTALQGAGLPTVAASAPAEVAHRCAGTPLTCALETKAALTATAADPAGQPLTYEWTAVAPDALRAEAATVIFEPSAADPAPALRIETAGGPISGDWKLRVRVRDSEGFLAQDEVVLRVGNRAPVIATAPAALDHRYVGGVYRATGVLSVAVADPDGDPVTTTLATAEPAGSGCSAAFVPATGAFDLACPQPGQLVGGVARTLAVAASDANGAAVAADVPIEIRNNPPVVQPAASAAMTELALDHGVTACPTTSGSCFVVQGTQPFVASDPDGDPISDVELSALVAADRPSSVGEVGAGSPATFRFTTPVSKPAEFRAASGASGFVLRGVARDPFGPSAGADLAIRINDRPPVLRTRVAATSLVHAYDLATGAWRGTADLSIFDDPDGDPLSAAPSAGDAACSAFDVASGTVRVTCSAAYALSTGGLPPLAAFLGNHLVVARASDGWSTAEAAATVTVTNRAPTATPFSGTVTSCICACAKWNYAGDTCVSGWKEAVNTGGAELPVQVSDLDGDPLRVTVSPATFVVTPVRTALPGSTNAMLSGASYPASYTVTITDGDKSVTTTSTVTGVTCPTAGTPCG